MTLLDETFPKRGINERDTNETKLDIQKHNQISTYVHISNTIIIETTSSMKRNSSFFLIIECNIICITFKLLHPLKTYGQIPNRKKRMNCIDYWQITRRDGWVWMTNLFYQCPGVAQLAENLQSPWYHFHWDEVWLVGIFTLFAYFDSSLSRNTNTVKMSIDKREHARLKIDLLSSPEQKKLDRRCYRRNVRDGNHRKI